MNRRVESEHILDHVVKGLFFALIILVPLVYFKVLYDSFALPKRALAQFLIFEMVLLWLMKMNVKKTFKIVRSPIYLPLFIFLGIEVLSLFWAGNIHLSMEYIWQDIAFGLLVVGMCSDTPTTLGP